MVLAASSKPVRAAVVVDPLSTGITAAAAVCEREVTCVSVMSFEIPASMGVVNFGHNSENAVYAHKLNLSDFDGDVEALAAAIRALPGLEVEAVIAGAETGVRLADALSETLGLVTNGSESASKRRCKHEMGEAVREAGVRAVKQTRVQSVAEAEAFIKREWNTDEAVEAVVKPEESAGSDGVYICRTMEETLKAVETIVTFTNALGAANDAALLQEFLRGDEYVVDQVSLDGVHKLVAIWRYDKRKANGGDFVYFGGEAMDPAEYPELIAYTRDCLDAIGVRNGPSHSEVMMTADGPCLVEVNSRFHGGEGHWVPLASACFGTNQVEAGVDCYLDPAKFAALPDVAELKQHGVEVHVVNYEDGIYRGAPGLAEVRKMASYVGESIPFKEGDDVKRSVDALSIFGGILLAHEDTEVVRKDYAAIVEMEERLELLSVQKVVERAAATSTTPLLKLGSAVAALNPAEVLGAKKMMGKRVSSAAA